MLYNQISYAERNPLCGTNLLLIIFRCTRFRTSGHPHSHNIQPPLHRYQYQSLLELKEEKSLLNSTVLLYLLFQLTVQLEKQTASRLATCSQLLLPATSPDQPDLLQPCNRSSSSCRSVTRQLLHHTWCRVNLLDSKRILLLRHFTPSHSRCIPSKNLRIYPHLHSITRLFDHLEESLLLPLFLQHHRLMYVFVISILHHYPSITDWSVQNLSHFWGCVSDILTSNRSNLSRSSQPPAWRKVNSLLLNKLTPSISSLLARSNYDDPSHPPGSALLSDAILLLRLWLQHRIFVWCHRQHICHSMKKLWSWWAKVMHRVTAISDTSSQRCSSMGKGAAISSLELPECLVPNTILTFCAKAASNWVSIEQNIRAAHKGPEVHHFCPVTRIRVDGTTGTSGASTSILDIGTEVMKVRAPVTLRQSATIFLINT